MSEYYFNNQDEYSGLARCTFVSLWILRKFKDKLFYGTHVSLELGFVLNVFSEVLQNSLNTLFRKIILDSNFGNFLFLASTSLKVSYEIRKA